MNFNSRDSMYNLIDAKHRFTSRPLKAVYDITKDVGPIKDLQAHQELAFIALWAYVGLGTVTINVYPIIKLIDLGKHGSWQVVATSYKWLAHQQRYDLLPTFHTYRHPSPAYRAGFRSGGKLGGRIATRLVPGVGWAMLAYDIYDVAFNQSLWGFDYSGSSGSVEWASG